MFGVADSIRGRLLVLGASGFVGRCLFDHLRDQPSLEIVRTSTPRRLDAGGEFIPWKAPEPLLVDGQFNYIVHLATPASASLTVDSPREMFHINVAATEQLITFCERQVRPPRVLLASSGAVYGDLPLGLQSFDEMSALAVNPNSANAAYAEGKRVAEFLLAEAHQRGVCESVIVRMFAFSGRYLPLDRHFAIGNFVRDAVTRNRITINGDGRATRSYLDGSDMAEWLVQALNVGGSEFPYHIGSEEPVSILELANLVADRAKVLLGRNLDVELLGRSAPTDGFHRYVPSTRLTRAALGVRQTVTLQDSVDSMIFAAQMALRDRKYL